MSLPPSYFDRLYAGNPDPWRFETSPYEAGKYAATLAALSRPRYASGLEVGCSIGVLTEALGRRCDALLAVDVAESALDQARRRNAGNPAIRFERQQFPVDAPAGRFDLILLSEMLYYLDAEGILDAAMLTARIALPGADILLVHWLGPTPDYPLTGNQAADAFVTVMLPHADWLHHRAEPDYRIDLLRRHPD